MQINMCSNWRKNHIWVLDALASHSYILCHLHLELRRPVDENLSSLSYKDRKQQPEKISTYIKIHINTYVSFLANNQTSSLPSDVLIWLLKMCIKRSQFKQLWSTLLFLKGSSIRGPLLVLRCYGFIIDFHVWIWIFFLIQPIFNFIQVESV